MSGRKADKLEIWTRKSDGKRVEVRRFVWWHYDHRTYASDMRRYRVKGYKVWQTAHIAYLATVFDPPATPTQSNPPKGSQGE